MKLLSPREITQAAANAGAVKAALTDTDLPRLMVSAIMAGAYIALGGIFSVTLGFGFPELTAANPGLQRLLSGIAFPLGLILVVVLGAELFTGNNAILIPSMSSGKHGLGLTLRNWVMVYIGNFIGALAFTYFMVHLCGLTASGPWHDAVVRIAENKVSMGWWTVFFRGIGANWCVCLAVWLALSGKTLLEKAFGCWFPVMAFVALGYEHSIANMFFIPLGLMEGAQVGIWQSIEANLIPATLGNIIGGALLVGAVNSYLQLKKHD